MHVGYIRIGDSRQITRYNSKTSTVASVVNLVRSQVYHTQRPTSFAVRLPWCSASRGFASDSWYLLQTWSWLHFSWPNPTHMWTNNVTQRYRERFQQNTDDRQTDKKRQTTYCNNANCNVWLNSNQGSAQRIFSKSKVNTAIVHGN